MFKASIIDIEWTTPGCTSDTGKNHYSTGSVRKTVHFKYVFYCIHLFKLWIFPLLHPKKLESFGVIDKINDHLKSITCLSNQYNVVFL